MKILLVCMLLLFAIVIVQAQAPGDSLTYQLQRKKINDMLNQRLQTFGHYDRSLSMHTGIFGLQTKKDIRRSNDILLEIVKTDEEVFRQLKILLDYRTFQQTEAVSHSHNMEDNSLAYMSSINKLRNELDGVKKNAEHEKEQQDRLIRFLSIVIVLMFMSILYLISQKRAVKV